MRSGSAMRLARGLVTLFMAVAIGAAAMAGPVFIQGYDLSKRGIEQMRPTMCAPTVAYLMGVYGETRGLDLLKDGATSQDQIQQLATLMKCQLGSSTADIVSGLKSMYGGYLVDGKGEKYPNAWSQVRESGNWVWRDYKKRIDENLPIMLGLEGGEPDLGHVVFAFGYEVLNAGAANQEDWAFVFDPLADPSGTNTAKNPKKWKIERSTLKILSAVDALDTSIEHIDRESKKYQGRELLNLFTGNSVPEPAAPTLVLTALLLMLVLRHAREASARTPAGRRRR